MTVKRKGKVNKGSASYFISFMYVLSKILRFGGNFPEQCVQNVSKGIKRGINVSCALLVAVFQVTLELNNSPFVLVCLTSRTHCFTNDLR